MENELSGMGKDDERRRITRGLIWLWKHRHCWEQLKYLYEHWFELKLILGNISVHDDRPGEYQADTEVDPERIDRVLACLREFDRIPLARQMTWKVTLPDSPPTPGLYHGTLGSKMVFVTNPDKPDNNPFLERLDPKKRKQWPSPPPSERPSALAWLKEKPELLKTHPGWFVAYQDGARVALEPDCDKMAKALDVALGSPRRPVQFHEIIEQPVKHRGPSPRFYDGYNGRLWMDPQALNQNKLKPPQWAIDAGRD